VTQVLFWKHSIPWVRTTGPLRITSAIADAIVLPRQVISSPRILRSETRTRTGLAFASAPYIRHTVLSSLTSIAAGYIPRCDYWMHVTNPGDRDRLDDAKKTTCRALWSGVGRYCRAGLELTAIAVHGCTLTSNVFSAGLPSCNTTLYNGVWMEHGTNFTRFVSQTPLSIVPMTWRTVSSRPFTLHLNHPRCDMHQDHLGPRRSGRLRWMHLPRAEYGDSRRWTSAALRCRRVVVGQ
jgi:hypothetical protein